MKRKYIIANWKSYKTLNETREWFKLFYKNLPDQVELEDKEVIICPPYPLILPVFEIIMQYSTKERIMIKLGSQNISPFEEGPYTGEVSARLISEFCSYSIIGHSERRQIFSESDKMLAEKVELVKNYNINPIFCVQGVEAVIPLGVEIIAYEPVFAIGSGKPDTPEDADEVAKFFKEKYGLIHVLYGGSVTAENVSSFTIMENIDGVLVGGASRDPEHFIQILNKS